MVELIPVHQGYLGNNFVIAASTISGSQRINSQALYCCAHGQTVYLEAPSAVQRHHTCAKDNEDNGVDMMFDCRPNCRLWNPNMVTHPSH